METLKTVMLRINGSIPKEITFKIKGGNYGAILLGARNDLLLGINDLWADIFTHPCTTLKGNTPDIFLKAKTLIKPTFNIMNVALSLNYFPHANLIH